MRYLQCGEQSGIGATAHFFQLGGKNIVVDWGGGFEGFGEKRSDLHPAGDFLKDTRVDLILVTHAHLDHLLYIPRLLKLHPEALCYMGGKTFDIASVLLEDARKIGERNIQAALRSGEWNLPSPTVTRGELNYFLSTKQIELIEGDTWIELPDGWNGWKIGFHSSGHVTDAKMVFLDPPNDRRVFLTGDISSHNQLVVPGVMLPDEEFLGDFFDAPDVVMVTECTNGSREPKRPRSEEKAEFLRRVSEVQARGGISLIATFGFGRSTEAAMMLAEAGIVPWVDGMARDMMKIEAPELIEGKKVRLVPKDPQNFSIGWKEREEILATPGSVIIAPSGSLEGGYAVHYAKHVLETREGAVFFLGHIFDDSAAQSLVLKRGDTVSLPEKEGRVSVNVRSDVFRFDFSSHDYGSALAERVRLVKPETLIGHHSGASEGVDGFDGLCAKVQGLMGASAPRMLRGTHLAELNLLPKGRR